MLLFAIHAKHRAIILFNYIYTLCFIIDSAGWRLCTTLLIIFFCFICFCAYFFGLMPVLFYLFTFILILCLYRLLFVLIYDAFLLVPCYPCYYHFILFYYSLRVLIYILDACRGLLYSLRCLILLCYLC